MRHLFSAILATVIWATGVTAQQQDTRPTCQMDKATFKARIDDFVGVWTVTMLEGWLEAPNLATTIPIPQETDELTIFAINNELVGENLKTPGTYAMTYVSGGDWQFDLRYAELMPLNYAVMLEMHSRAPDACDPEDMLQLKASGTVTDPTNGAEIEFATQFYFVDMNQAVGGTVATMMGGPAPIRVTRTFIMTLN